MRLVIKVMGALCLIVCLAVFSLTLFGLFMLPDTIVTFDGEDNSNIIYKVQSVSSDGQVRTVNTETDDEKNAYYSLLGIFPFKKVSVKTNSRVFVYPSGQAFGLKLYSDGVLIVGIDSIDTPSGRVSPASEAGLQVGDVIKTVNGQNVDSNSDVSRLISASGGEEMQLLIIRNGVEKTVSFKPVRSDGGTLKAGMWIRDSVAGIGTMTFYTEKNCFGGLGHAVTDVDTGETVPIIGGEAVAVNIEGCVKGNEQAAGALFGTFTNEKLGDLSVNSDRGVFGQISSTPSQTKLIPVAFRQEITTGEAQIISTVDKDGPQLYSVNILKLTAGNEKNSKNMVIEITDERLIGKTGGIVQGMSGSPIIQNGKLVGAVTHVFVNNPKQGYGIFAENMLDELNNNSIDSAA